MPSIYAEKNLPLVNEQDELTDHKKPPVVHFDGSSKNQNELDSNDVHQIFKKNFNEAKKGFYHQSYRNSKRLKFSVKSKNNVPALAKKLKDLHRHKIQDEAFIIDGSNTQEHTFGSNNPTDLDSHGAFDSNRIITQKQSPQFNYPEQHVIVNLNENPISDKIYFRELQNVVHTEIPAMHMGRDEGSLKTRTNTEHTNIDKKDNTMKDSFKPDS